MSRLINLLMVIALALMPFGMAAPAAAAGDHSRAASSAMTHCPDEGTADQGHGSVDECTMACASTLPAVAPASGELLVPAAAPSVRTIAQPLTGLHPETATPPPRFA